MNWLEIIEIRSARDGRKGIETQPRHLFGKAVNDAKQQSAKVFNLVSTVNLQEQTIMAGP